MPVHSPGGTTSGRTVFLLLTLPCLFAIFVTWQRSSTDDLDSILHDDLQSPALELLQRDAKMIQTARTQKDLGHATKTTTASAFGIGANGVGNLPTFITGLLTDFCVIALCIIIFYYWSHRYPILFGNGNISNGTVKAAALDKTKVDSAEMTLLGWAYASWKLNNEDVWEAAGLDKAMLLHFVELCIRAMKFIAIPMFFIVGPLNCLYGGNAAGEDHESWFSLGNVQFYSWLYWVTGLACCYVGFVICKMCHQGMRDFMPLRKKWLLRMNDVRCRTLMMTGIPNGYRSEIACKRMFEMLVPGRVENVYITKDTSERLQGFVAQRTQFETYLDGAKHDGLDEKVEEYAKQLEEVNGYIKAERNRIFMEAAREGGVNLETGFITFKDRVTAESVLRMSLGQTTQEWVMDSAPEPLDIIWSDFTEDTTAGAGRMLLGYVLTAGVMIIYMPLVVAIANIAEAINLGPFQSIWSSEAPSIGLTIMVDFLPTILVLIFTNCFSVYDKSNQQYKLTCWYFWMNILFVVLVTALGTNFMSFVKTLANDPLKVFHLFATTMPNCTHYYMNYLGMQWYSMAMQLTRYMNVIKYRIFIRHHEEKEARDLSEPEDQDYYGIGSRTARFSTLMTIAIVYGTLSPPCSVLGWITMVWIRTLFGYIFVFNETRKPDLGGAFFHRALVNMYIALHVYFVLMLGVLYVRGNDCVPAVLAACGWVYVFYSQNKFYQYQWEYIQLDQLFDPKNKLDLAKKHELYGRYVQPELYDD